MGGQKRFDMILGKQRARARLREFIGKHIFDRKNARVLCLPGENGREIEHVYRKLGFRDENITGLERDPSVLRNLRSHYPKISVVCDDVEQFGQGESTGPFHVVSLDYCGSYNHSKISPLARLFWGGSLADKVVVATNFFIGREKKDVQASMEEYHHQIIDTQLILEEEGRGPPPSMAYDDGIGECREAMISRVAIDVLTHTAPRLRVLGTTRFQDVHSLFSKQMIAMPSRVSELFDAKFLVDVAGRLLLLYVYKRSGAFTVLAHESYSYVNDAGHRMDSDFVAFGRPDLRRLAGPDGISEQGGGIVLDPNPREFATIEEYLSWLTANVDLERKMALFASDLEMPERVHLGGGAIPFDSEKTKAKVIALLKKGRSDEEIMSKLPVTVGTLRALKAHITMGTY